MALVPILFEHPLYHFPETAYIAFDVIDGTILSITKVLQNLQHKNLVIFLPFVCSISLHLEILKYFNLRGVFEKYRDKCHNSFVY